MLQTWNWEVTARNGERWKKIIGEAITTKRKKKKTDRPMAAAILERKTGQSQRLYLHRLHKHRKYVYIYALNGIRQHDASVGRGSRHYRLQTTQPQ